MRLVLKLKNTNLSLTPMYMPTKTRSGLTRSLRYATSVNINSITPHALQLYTICKVEGDRAIKIVNPE